METANQKSVIRRAHTKRKKYKHISRDNDKIKGRKQKKK